MIHCKADLDEACMKCALFHNCANEMVIIKWRSTQAPQQRLETTEQEEKQNRQLLYEAIYGQIHRERCKPKRSSRKY